MADGVWDDQPYEKEPLSGRPMSPELERERLRDVLGFPEAVESGESYGRRAVAGERDPEPESAALASSLDADVAPSEVDRDIGQRLERLTRRVEDVAGLVESLLDHVAAPGGGDSGSLTADELADIAAQIVRIIESRLETQSAHFDEVVAALGGRPVEVHHSGPPSAPGMQVIEDRMTMIARAIMDVKKAVTQLEAPSDLQEMAILAHLDRWFAEKEARQSSDVEQLRSDVGRFDQALIDVTSRMAELPDRQAFRDLYQTLSQQFYQGQLSVRDGLTEMQDRVALLPAQVALEQPIARLDATLLNRLGATLTETSEGLAQKVDDLLAERVQRFEALSQAMMTMVGDPVDSLTAKLAQVVRAQESVPNALEAIAELTQMQAQLASAITSLRQDGIEREVLLREALAKLDRLTGDTSS